MKAQKSPLLLNNFFLLNHHYQFVQPQTADELDVMTIMENYNIDIDFAVKELSNNTYQLFTKIDINNVNKPAPGYQLFVEGFCVFAFNPESTITDIEKGQLLNYSGLNICINSLRNILATTTANGPFGKYTLPSIDMNHLFLEKAKTKES